MRTSRLDGLRGVAIVAVVLHHHAFIEIGWAGVDLFFVLSGFLITRILWNTRGRSDYWSTFYRKRALRILPPLLLLLLVGIALTKHLSLWAAAGYLFFLGNVVDALGHGSPVLGITWSLAIEEHFYLMWPVAVLFLSRKRLVQLSLLILCIEPILRIAFTHVHPIGMIYLLTPFRLDGLAAGSLLALLDSHGEAQSLLKRYSGGLALASVALYAGLLTFFGSQFDRDADTRLFNGLGYSVIAMGAFFVIAYVLLNENAWISKALSFKPLAGLGLISYGVYLFHLLAIGLAEKIAHVKTFPVPAPILHRLALFDIPCLLVFAWLSYRFYELPIMRRGNRPKVQDEVAELQKV
jgi:peptidoglycan/LPS O-acetylase OafA/YrhL